MSDPVIGGGQVSVTTAAKTGQAADNASTRVATVVIGAIMALLLLLAIVLGLLAQDLVGRAQRTRAARADAERFGPPVPIRPRDVPVPAPDPRLAGKPLSGNPAAWFGADNYPPAAQRAGEQGRAVARLAIGANGVPTACAIIESSGSSTLDIETCRVAMRRGRFTPARDGEGRAVASTYRLPVRWVLPDE